MSISESDVKIRLERLGQILRRHPDYTFDGDIFDLWQKTQFESDGLEDFAIDYFVDRFTKYKYAFDKHILRTQLAHFVKIVKNKFLPIVIKGPKDFEEWPCAKMPTREQVKPFQQSLRDIIVESFRIVFPFSENIPSDDIEAGYTQSVILELVYGNQHYAISRLIALSHDI